MERRATSGKIGWFAGLALLMGAIFVLAGTADAALVSLRADNFRRGETEDGSWAVLFDITATHNSDEGAVTRIYDLTFHIEADATDMNNGQIRRLSRDSSFSAPEGFAKLNLAPGDSAKDSFSIPYVNFKGGWKWEGEEKNEKFHLSNIEVSNIRAKYDSGKSPAGQAPKSKPTAGGVNEEDARAGDAERKKIMGRVWVGLPYYTKSGNVNDKRNIKFDFPADFGMGNYIYVRHDGDDHFFEGLRYDAATGEFGLVLSGSVVAHARLVPGKPDKLIVSGGFPDNDDERTAYKFDYELVPEEYAQSLGEAAKKAAPTGTFTEYSHEPHWMSGIWRTRAGDQMIFSISPNLTFPRITPLKDDGSLYDHSGAIYFTAIWSDEEECWLMAFIASGENPRYHGSIRPSAGRDAPSEILDVTLDYFMNGNETDSDFEGRHHWRGTMEKVLDHMPTAVYNALDGTWISKSGTKMKIVNPNGQWHYERQWVLDGKEDQFFSHFYWDSANSELVMAHHENSGWVNIQMTGTFSEDGKTLSVKGNWKGKSFESVLTNPKGRGLPKGFLSAGTKSP
jgi:hypothetical protein